MPGLSWPGKFREDNLLGVSWSRKVGQLFKSVFARWDPFGLMSDGQVQGYKEIFLIF